MSLLSYKLAVDRMISYELTGLSVFLHLIHTDAVV